MCPQLLVQTGPLLHFSRRLTTGASHYPRPSLSTPSLTLSCPASSSPEDLTSSSLLDILGGLDRSNDHATLLVSPSFASIVQDPRRLIVAALGNIRSRRLAATHRQPPPLLQWPARIWITTAVVDGFRPALSSSRRPDQEAAREGASVLLTPKSAVDVQPASRGGIGGSKTESNGVGYLSLHATAAISRAGRDKPALMSIGLRVPLAETIFQTGTLATIFRFGYDVCHESFTVKEISADRIDNVSIDLSEHRCDTCNLSIPLVALTNPSEIASVRGNVISQVVDELQRTVPASRELEQAINTRPVTDPKKPRKVPIWAVIYPKGYFGAPDQTKDSESLQNEDGGDESSIELSIERLEEGLKLHRVTSGGGGWSGSQGPIALEPGPTLEPQPSASLDAILNGGLESVADKGDMIQYFLSSDNLKTTARHQAEPQWDQTALLVGALPDPQDETVSSTRGDSVVTQNTFSIFSSKGFDVSLRPLSDEKQSSHKKPITSIDIPGSILDLR